MDGPDEDFHRSDSDAGEDGAAGGEGEPAQMEVEDTEEILSKCLTK